MKRRSSVAPMSASQGSPTVDSAPQSPARRSVASAAADGAAPPTTLVPPTAKARAAFRHASTTVLALHHFAPAPDAAQLPLGSDEEHSVCAELPVALAALQGARPWTPALADRFSSATQQIFDHSAVEVARAEAWGEYVAARAQVSSAMLAVAQSAFAQCGGASNGAAADATATAKATVAAGFTRVGTSHLHSEKGLFVHIWQTPEGARNFIQGWSRVWQALLEFRIEGIRAPFSTLFSLQGTYVSVTALPPIVTPGDRQPPAESPAVRMPTPGKPCATMAEYMALQLMSALHVPLEAQALGLPLHRCLDGNFYVLSLFEILSGSRITAFPGRIARGEMLMGRTLMGDTRTCDEFLANVAVPGSLSVLLSDVGQASSSSKSASAAMLVQDSTLRNALHESGVNIAAMYDVQRRATEITEGTADAVLEHIVVACNTEMVGRVLKQFARIELARIPLAATEQRLDALNRLARFILTNDVPFMRDHVLPALRAKFFAPPGFEIGYADIHPASAVGVMSRKIGCEYDSARGAFGSFLPVAGLWSTLTERPPFLTIDARDTAAVKETVTATWNQALALPTGTALQRAFVARACVASLANGAAKKLMATMWEGVLAADASTMAYVSFERVRLAGLMAEVALNGVKKEEAVGTRVALLRDLLASAVQSSSTKNGASKNNAAAAVAADDCAVVACGLMHCALQREAASLPIDPSLARDAVAAVAAASPNAQLPFCATLLAALRRIDATVPKMPPAALSDYYALVETAARLLAETSADAAASFCERAVSAVAWTSEPHAKRRGLALKAASLRAAASGAEHPTTFAAAFSLALFVAQAERLTEAGVALRGVVESAKAAAVLPRLKAVVALGQLARRPATVAAVAAVLKKCAPAEAVPLQSYVDACSTIAAPNEPEGAAAGAGGKGKKPGASLFAAIASQAAGAAAGERKAAAERADFRALQAPRRESGVEPALAPPPQKSPPAKAVTPPADGDVKDENAQEGEAEGGNAAAAAGATPPFAPLDASRGDADADAAAAEAEAEAKADAEADRARRARLADARRRRRQTISVVPVVDPVDARPQWRRQLDLMFDAPVLSDALPRQRRRDAAAAAEAAAKAAAKARRSGKNSRPKPRAEDNNLHGETAPSAADNGGASAGRDSGAASAPLPETTPAEQPPPPAHATPEPQRHQPHQHDRQQHPHVAGSRGHNAHAPRLLDAIPWSDHIPPHPSMLEHLHHKQHQQQQQHGGGGTVRSTGGASPPPAAHNARAANYHLRPIARPADRTASPRVGPTAGPGPAIVNRNLPLKEQIQELSTMCGISPAQARRLLL